MLLAESGTRSLLAAAHGPCTTGEKTLALDLLPALGPGMLVLADRNFISWKLWTAAVGDRGGPVLAGAGLVHPDPDRRCSMTGPT